MKGVNGDEKRAKMVLPKIILDPLVLVNVSEDAFRNAIFPNAPFNADQLNKIEQDFVVHGLIFSDVNEENMEISSELITRADYSIELPSFKMREHVKVDEIIDVDYLRARIEQVRAVFPKKKVIGYYCAPICPIDKCKVFRKDVVSVLKFLEKELEKMNLFGVLFKDLHGYNCPSNKKIESTKMEIEVGGNELHDLFEVITTTDYDAEIPPVTRELNFSEPCSSIILDEFSTQEIPKLDRLKKLLNTLQQLPKGENTNISQLHTSKEFNNLENNYKNETNDLSSLFEIAQRLESLIN